MSNLSSYSTTFTCPIPHCGHAITLSIIDVTEHVRSSHRSVNEKMGLPNTIGYCKDCNLYTRFKHFHCHECKECKYFRTNTDLIAHLKAQHAKWFPETECKHGDKCHGKSGACGFNHLTRGLVHITNDDMIPKNLCRHDRPWDDVRCHATSCRFDHFRGRVKYLIMQKAQSVATTTVPESTVPELTEEYESDFEEISESTDELPVQAAIGSDEAARVMFAEVHNKASNFV